MYKTPPCNKSVTYSRVLEEVISLHGREGQGVQEGGGEVLHPRGHGGDGLPPRVHPARCLPGTHARLCGWVPPQLDHGVQGAHIGEPKVDQLAGGVGGKFVGNPAAGGKKYLVPCFVALSSEPAVQRVIQGCKHATQLPHPRRKASSSLGTDP